MAENTDTSARLAQLFAESANRSAGALKLFRPLPTQEPVFRAVASEIAIRGGNRAGKSLTAAILTAAVALQQPITSYSGEKFLPLYQAERPLSIWVVAYDGRYIGDTIYRLLFRPGLFKTIRDKNTGLWRAYEPWNPEDTAREEEAKPSPPLIPSRLIDPKGWSWENRAGRIFDVCRLINGTEIRAWSSKAEPKMGDPIDWIWIDEDLYHYGHYQEYRMRTSDTKGKIVWAFFPKGRNWAARDLSNRANSPEQKNRVKPDVQEVVLKYSANPFIDADEKRKKLEGMSETERLARDEGEFVTDKVQMYPNFSDFIHATPRLIQDDDCAVDKVLRDHGLEPPEDWTRYLVLDPGHTLAAVLFAAVPPPTMGDYIVLYDELYLERHDADSLAKKVRDKVGSWEFEAFIIDDHAGRMTPMGYAQGQTVKQHYVSAFRKYDIRSVTTGHTFVPGADNIEAGIQAVRELLTIRRDGTCKLKYVAKKMPNFKDEMLMYSKEISGDGVVGDKPAPRQRDHLCDCLRYAAAYSPRYKRPVARLFSGGVEAMKNGWANIFGPSKADKSIYLGPGVATH